MSEGESPPSDPHAPPVETPRDDARDVPVAQSARGVGGWLRWALVDPSRSRPRVLVRLGIHAVGVLGSYVVGALLAWASGASTAGRAAAMGLQTLLVVVVTWACARWIDRRRPAELLGAWSMRAIAELAVGATLGAVSIGVIAALEAQTGLARYAPLALDATTWLRAGALALFFVAVAIDEELWFRAYQLTNLAEALEGRVGARGSRGLALLLSALVFGLAHALNPNASLLTTTNIAIGGVFLGVTYALTGRLYLALGLHFAWNTAQCWLDMPVSGQVLGDELFVHREELGDDLVTGGAFGPEGGILGLAAMILGTVLCVIHARLVGPREVAKLDVPDAS